VDATRGTSLFEPDRQGARFGPLWFVPGIAPRDAAALLLAVITNISMITYFTFMQPYVLTEILHVPAERQGVLTGNLGSLQEIISLLLMSFIGALSDTAGRRLLGAIGFGFIAAGFFFYPLAGSETQLLLARIMFGIGVAMVPVVVTACVVAYVQEVSRGKWSATVSVCNSIAIVFVAVVMAKIPDWLTSRGLDAALSGRYAYWIGTLICLLAVPLAWFRLRETTLEPAASRDSILTQVANGLRLARANPRLPLAYTAGIIGRGDLIVISTFLSLWVVHVGTDAGVSTGQSMVRAGIIFGVIQTSALIWAPIMGTLVDHLNRVTALALAMAIAAAGYLLMGRVADPFGGTVFGVAVLLGMGENSVLIASIALVGQETPRRLQGTSVGMFLVMGAIGVIVANQLGGQLFDHWSRTGPFTLMAVLNACVMSWALVVRWRVRG
jgi:MFS family permease